MMRPIRRATHAPGRPPGPPALAVALAAALALAAAGCSGKKQVAAQPVPEVAVAEVVQRDVPIGAELTAQVRGYEDVEIRARVEGYLVGIDYREGMLVKRGQSLFRIDDQPYRLKLAEAKADLARAQANLAKAEMDVQRYTPLAAERAISQAELDNALAARRAAKAQVEAQTATVDNAALNLSYTHITAPMDGLAGLAQRKVGDLVGKGEPTLLTVVSRIDPIRVSVSVPEVLYLRNAEKLAAVVAQPDGTPPPGGGSQLQLADGSIYPERGHIIFVDRAIDPSTGTIRADIAFPNAKGLLRPGQYAKLLFREDVRNGALLVPQRAIQELQGQYSLVVVNSEGKAESRKARVGPRIGSLWIVEEGIKPGERVIVEGALRARDGMPVSAKPVAAEPQGTGGAAPR